MKTWLALTLAVLVPIACASTLPHATDAGAAVAARRYPGTTRADLEHGREVYVNRCSSCHALFLPGRFPAEKWHRMVGEMSVRAKLQAADRDALLRYLTAYAKDEPVATLGDRAPRR